MDKIYLRLHICKIIGLCCWCLFPFIVDAQTFTIKGKVTDAQTGAAIPFATVLCKSPRAGVATDFEGNYTLVLAGKTDSIAAAYVGYLKKTVPVVFDQQECTVDIQMTGNSTELETVVVSLRGYENPAWRIMRQIMAHKNINDYSNLKAYEYESYNRIELSATNFGEKLRKKKIVKQMLPLLDSMKKIAGKDGVATLPLFISESYTENFFKKSPFKKRENILKTRVKGVGFEDGTLLSQLVGSTFLQHNFYKNYINVAGKQFVSPITDQWRLFYDYELEDRNAKIDTVACFKITFKPKAKSDLAFSGSIWIAKSNFALCQISAAISPDANLNFINKVEIQQESKPFEGVWFPSKSRILVKIDELNKNTPGLIAQFYLNNSNLRLTEPKKDAFFESAVVVNDGANVSNEQFWKEKTPPNLSLTQQNVYRMIDTLKGLPAVKTYIDVADMVLNGYYKVGKVGIGPYLFSYARNDVEGNRFRLGFKTNYDFSKKIILEPYIAYGDRDDKWKYGLAVNYIISRKPWTQVGVSYSHDLNQVALLSDNYNYVKNNLFAAFSRFGKINRNRRAFMQNRFDVYVSTDIAKNLHLKLELDRWGFDPLYRFSYNFNSNQAPKRNFITSEFKTELVWTPGVMTLLSDNKNKPTTIKVNSSFPTFTLHYTQGIKGVLNSDLDYKKISININQKLKLGMMGKGEYSLTAGIIPSTVPYPILENHLGNTTFFYNKTSFSTMRFFEFMSDRYVSLMYTQHFEGLLFNRIPLLERLNLRELVTFNILYGSLSSKNNRLFMGNRFNNTLENKGLGQTPYIEVGYGVENIFKFLRVDFVHRLNYLHNNGPRQEPLRKFAIKFSAQVRL